MTFDLEAEAPPMLPGSFLDRPGGLIFVIAAPLLWCALFWITTHGGWERWAFSAGGVPFFLRYRPFSHAYDVRITMRFDHAARMEALLGDRGSVGWGTDAQRVVAKCSQLTDLLTVNLVAEAPAAPGWQEDSELGREPCSSKVELTFTFAAPKVTTSAEVTSLAARKVSELLDSDGDLRPFVVVPVRDPWWRRRALANGLDR